jgi:hypothetical protein
LIHVDRQFAFATVGDLTAKVSYSLLPLNIRLLRRTQEFRFRAVKKADGQFLWTFVE